MINIWGQQQKGRCDGVSRRDFVRVGALGLAGLGLADVLRLRARAAETGTSPRKKSVILYWLDGGPTHMETYDPKPYAPAEYRGPFRAIQTSAPGIQLNELLVHQARVMDKVSVIRSMHHDNGDHFAAAHWMLTGYHGSTAASQDPQFPSCGSIVTKARGPNRSGVPAYVAVPRAASVGIQPGYFSGAYLGSSYNPFMTGGDPNNANFKVDNLALAGGLTVNRLEDRRGLLSSLDRTRRDIDKSGLMDSVDSFDQEAYQMVTGEAARKAFDINSEDPKTRDRYGREHYGQCALLARRLVEAGVTFVNVHNGGWDHHWDLEAGMKGRLPSMDRSIGVLIEDLHERGMLDDVMVVVMGEFGRTPRLNNGLGNGTPGRDHWGNVMSVLIGGGGLKGGQIVGASNAKGEVPAERPIKPADVLATLYRVMGVDLATHFTNPAGRPVPINNYGEVIGELV